MKSRLLLLLLVSFWLWPALVSADEARWKQYMGAAEAAHQRGDYGEAIKQLETALNEAEEFGEQDPRLSATLNNLAELYRAQGRTEEAERLLREHEQ